MPFIYLDFEVEINRSCSSNYPIAVRSWMGEMRAILHFPYNESQLESLLQELAIAILRPDDKPLATIKAANQAVQQFGSDLFDSLFTGNIRSLYYESQRSAAQQKSGLRIKLLILEPKLAGLPWEFLFDERNGEYVCLSRNTPIVRTLEVAQPRQPLTVQPPLQILGVIASPQELPALDIALEKACLEQALSRLQVAGLVKLTWLPSQTWRDLQRELRPDRGPWHILHFIGHGDFDQQSDEGYLLLCDDQGYAHRLSATQLGRLFADHSALRLVVLNACAGAQSSHVNLFASAAATLVRRGLSAVIAMQHAITDQAAIEFSTSFYDALADAMPVDTALTEARKAISLVSGDSLEWGTPVLYLRAPDGLIFTKQPVSSEPRPTQQLSSTNSKSVMIRGNQQIGNRNNIATNQSDVQITDNLQQGDDNGIVV